MTPTSPYTSRSLAQSLAVQTQVHLAGTVGRLLKQIRDLERVAPLFIEARLVRAVDRPNPLTVNVAGISTRQATRRVAGGFLYAAAGARSDISVHDNVVATRGEDSVCEIDDIDYEDQSKRFQLIGIRQAYELAERALLSGEPFDMLLFDCPLLLKRSIVAPEEGGRYAALRQTYQQTIEVIRLFWQRHRDKLFPWSPRRLEYLLEDLAKVPAEWQYASEFRYRNPIIEDRTRSAARPTQRGACSRTAGTTARSAGGHCGCG